MFQLISSVMAIALMSALVLVSINYLPAWQARARDTEQQMRRVLPQLEQAYDALTRSADGIAPATMADSDGGFTAQFMSTLQFVPAAPAGYKWTYGQRAADSSRYANMNYFCLAPTKPTAESTGRGLYLAAGAYSRDQIVISTACGADAWSAQPKEWGTVKTAVTFYVAYTPGISR